MLSTLQQVLEDGQQLQGWGPKDALEGVCDSSDNIFMDIFLMESPRKCISNSHW